MVTLPLPREAYTIDTLRDEAHELVEQGRVDPQQPIYALCRYIPGREWECFAIELEDHEFLQRDPIIDLFSHEDWDSD
jgi:hypothetical protein